MTANDQVRMPILLQLAELAMSDLDFRAIARHDLQGALSQFGYELNPRELSLVLKFREALEEAGIDLSLTEQLSAADLDLLRGIGEDMISRDSSGS
ncbi:MAG: hypothetical protein R2845_03850 [Thermomicrobiales bacterium]